MAYPCDHTKVLCDEGQYFEAVVVSSQFTGKYKIQQHQLVYLSLGNRMRAEIHTLAIRTLSPHAWAQSAVR